LTRWFECTFAAASCSADIANAASDFIDTSALGVITAMHCSRQCCQTLLGTASDHLTFNCEAESVLISGATGLRPLILTHGNYGGHQVPYLVVVMYQRAPVLTLNNLNDFFREVRQGAVEHQ
jgi:hypothetical protein